MADHTPDMETARDCFLDGAAGEFVPEDWERFIARVRAEARADLAREALALPDIESTFALLRETREEAHRG